jgi:hypothetical protein
MNKTTAVRGLLIAQEKCRPDVLFLSESHLTLVKAQNLKRRLKYDEVRIFASDGRSGGLVMFFQKDLNVTSQEVMQILLIFLLMKTAKMLGALQASMVNQVVRGNIFPGIICGVYTQNLDSRGSLRGISMRLCMVMKRKGEYETPKVHASFSECCFRLQSAGSWLCRRSFDLATWTYT